MINQLNQIDFYPKWLGQPMYPGGIPLKPEQVKYEGRSVRDIYYDNCDGDDGIPERDEKCIRDYIIYYINAPIFQSEFTEELTQNPELVKLSLDDLIIKCLEYGIDPL